MLNVPALTPCVFGWNTWPPAGGAIWEGCGHKELEHYWWWAWNTGGGGILRLWKPAPFLFNLCCIPHNSVWPTASYSGPLGVPCHDVLYPQTDLCCFPAGYFAHSKERSILVEHSFLFPPCPSLLVPYPLSEPCSKRLMKQNKEVKADKLFIRGRRLSLCWHYVTEQNSYLKLFPQLWMGPECQCYQSHTLKKTADNMPGKIGSLSLENVSHIHPPTLLSLGISECHKSLLADKLCWYKPTASGGTRETCHSHSGQDCQLCSSQADCTGCWLRERGREIAISQYRLDSPVCLSAAPLSRRKTLKYPRKPGGISANPRQLSPVSPTNTLITVWGRSPDNCSVELTLWSRRNICYFSTVADTYKCLLLVFVWWKRKKIDFISMDLSTRLFLAIALYCGLS